MKFVSAHSNLFHISVPTFITLLSDSSVAGLFPDGTPGKDHSYETVHNSASESHSEGDSFTKILDLKCSRISMPLDHKKMKIVSKSSSQAGD